MQRAIERGTGKYCSQACARRSSRASQEVNCANCTTLFRKHSVELQRTVNHFCTRSCAAKYNNRHKNLGTTRRSKAEAYLCNLIRQDFLETEVIENDRNFLSSGLEIDIFIAHCKLAIELNGPIHYFPIYGESKFKKIQSADSQKQLELQSAGYKLIVINISDIGYFKEVRIILKDYYTTYIKPLLEREMPEGGIEPPWDCSR